MTLLTAASASATVVAVLGVLLFAVLGIILFAVHKTRPRSLRFTASLARLLTLTLEVDSPQRPTPASTTKHSRPSGE